jgi:drug/metabolite transporter superfamily protein YnfA
MNFTLSITFFTFLLSAFTLTFIIQAGSHHLKFKDFLAGQCLLGALVCFCFCVAFYLGNPESRPNILLVYGLVCMLGSLCWMEEFLEFRPVYYDLAGLGIFMSGVAMFLLCL